MACNVREKNGKNISFFESKRPTEVLAMDSDGKNRNFPINIFNIKNCTVVANGVEKRHKKSLSNFEDNLVFIKNSKPLARNLQQLLNGSRSTNGNKGISLAVDSDLERRLEGLRKSRDPQAGVHGHPTKGTVKDRKGSRASSKIPTEAVNDCKITAQKVSCTEKLSCLLAKLEEVGPARTNAGVQKASKQYHQVNFSSTNINSLLKDIAKAKLLRKFHDSKAAIASEEEADESLSTSEPRLLNLGPKDFAAPTKTKLIREAVSMMQEQLFFEELLLILGEKGVDVENLFAYCYERMQIDTSQPGRPSTRPLTDSYSCINSEISVLDNASRVLRATAVTSAKKKRLQLDIRNLKPEIFSSNEEN
jgi:hypothetical protein